jgi:anti-anti-sigma regulatory factor
MEDIKLQVQDETLSIGGLRELTAANATIFGDRIRSAMSDSLRNLEIDMSRATFLDCCGLGALIALHKTACSRHGRFAW